MYSISVLVSPDSIALGAEHGLQSRIFRK
jgi:hypothetical protein